MFYLDSHALETKWIISSDAYQSSVKAEKVEKRFLKCEGTQVCADVKDLSYEYKSYRLHTSQTYLSELFLITVT